MSPLPISRSALDKLGKRLCRGSISADDQEQLELVLESYQTTLDVVQRRLAEFGMAPTSRVKSTGTLIDKLGRGTSFKSLQDVAGCRVVVDGGRADQDVVVSQVIEGFGPDTKVIDRRTSPMFGYRAVHVIVVSDSMPVEVQVRTVAQDTWAQTMERLADAWGRGVRYGEPLTSRDVEVEPGMTRGAVLDLMDDLADFIDQWERADLERHARRVALTDAGVEPQPSIAAVVRLLQSLDNALGE